MKHKTILWKGHPALWRSVLLMCAAAALGCDSYKEIDFQQEKCRQAPSAKVNFTQKSNRRVEFTMEEVSNAVGTEPIRVVWNIDGVSFASRSVSYQFAKTGEQTVIVVLTNRCFMQSEQKLTINVN